MFLLRFVDFFVRMWRLNAFWNVIFPVPVILKRFLALEFVLTFGILHAVFKCYPAGGFALAKHLWGRLGNSKILGKPILQAFNGLQRYGFEGKKQIRI
jgi:hypothetical protein